MGGAFGTPPTLEERYPYRLRVELLHQNGLAADPLGPDFDHAAGTYRIADGRGGAGKAMQRFAPSAVGGTTGTPTSPAVCFSRSSTSTAMDCPGATS